MAIASTAFHTLMRSRSMRYSATPGSNVSMSTRHAPCANVDSGMQRPPQVPDSGSAWSTRSSGVSRSTSPTCQPWGTAFRWVITAPLGNEVVPDV